MSRVRVASGEVLEMNRRYDASLFLFCLFVVVLGFWLLSFCCVSAYIVSGAAVQITKNNSLLFSFLHF